MAASRLDMQFSKAASVQNRRCIDGTVFFGNTAFESHDSFQAKSIDSSVSFRDGIVHGSD
eukprot:1497051-Pyramimonas_sp.AAC.1